MLLDLQANWRIRIILGLVKSLAHMSARLGYTPFLSGEINMSMTNEVSYQGGDRSIACSVALRLDSSGFTPATLL